MAVSPTDKHNTIIVDIDRTPRNADGLVQLLAGDAKLAVIDGHHVRTTGLARVAHIATQRRRRGIRLVGGGADDD